MHFPSSHVQILRMSGFLLQHSSYTWQLEALNYYWIKLASATLDAADRESRYVGKNGLLKKHSFGLGDAVI